VSGAGVDASVVRTVLACLTPLELELSLRILEDVGQQQTAVRQQWEQRVDRARYEADLAQRRYRHVDPENRLVARTLEQDWEQRLGTLADTEQAFARAQREAPLCLDETERTRLLALTHDLPTVWTAETTPVAERKELLRLLIADVTVTRQTAEILVQLRWVTNQVEMWSVPSPQRGARTSPVVLDRIRELASTHTDADIAACLNAEGLATAHGGTFATRRVQSLRHEHRIVKAPRS
jgi:hypothetical protein